MNKTYSLTPDNKGQMHSLLSPIFDLVRKNNINSYYQLQKCDDSYETGTQTKKGPYIFDIKPKTAHEIGGKTLSSFSVAKQRLTHYSMYSPSKFQNHPETPSVNLSKISQTIDFVKQKQQGKQKKHRRKNNSYSKNSQQQKMFRVNSKIKKHLVEEIDFDQIQKMFFKKRNTLTRYEYFIRQKNQNRNQSSGPKDKKDLDCQKTKVAIQKQEHFPLSQLPDHNSTIHQEWSPTKSPNRKKFWVKQPSKKQIKSQQYPIIAGKSFKTINT